MLEALGRDAAYDSTYCGRSGQRYGANLRMLGDRRADFGAESGDDVDHALGQPRVGQCSHEIESRERCVLRGLDDAGVAADDCGQKLPRRDRHGKIPRSDHAAYADRLAHRHGELVRHLRGNGGAEQAPSFAGVVIGGVNRFLHIAPGFGQDFTHLASHVPRVVFFAFDQDLGGAEYDLGTPRGRHQSPFLEGALGGLHCGIHVFS